MYSCMRVVIEKDTDFTGKCQIAELFNEHFMHIIADGVGEINESDHGKNLATIQA